MSNPPYPRTKHSLLQKLPEIVEHHPTEIYRVRDALNMHVEVLEQVLDRLRALELEDKRNKERLGKIEHFVGMRPL